ncbi:RPP0 [Ecytonucleospora hepatopenaei]|uniref:Large ribosomal subunit protein uL10 n=1 Tax=Ecytonucleospora hepatopenaei TaxID=646526 RepID=A0A1W0E435_9MICR|nr:RPP0 [Ecytonucleospora hepatopenaei]
MTTKTISPKKVAMFEKTQRMFTAYDKFMFLDLNKVLSTQFKNIKNELPGDVKFLFAKNKIMKKALEALKEKDNKFENVIGMVKNNNIVAFYENNDTANKIYDVCQKYKRSSFARYGDVAEEDIIIPTGVTKLGPDQIQLFHAARMNTKINKGNIEIAAEHKIVEGGKVVGVSEANLLFKLNIMPFNFGLYILKVFEGDEIFDKKVLAVSEKEVEDTFSEVVGVLATFSLGVGMLTEASLPYEISSAHKDIKKVSLALDFEI